MTLEEGIYTYLSAQAGVTSVVGTRLYPVFLQNEPTPPCVVFVAQKDNAYHVHEQIPNYATSRVSFTAYGRTREEADSAAQAVYNALISLSGLAGTVQVDRALFEGSSASYDFYVQLFSVESDFKFFYHLS